MKIPICQRYSFNKGNRELPPLVVHNQVSGNNGPGGVQRGFEGKLMCCVWAGCYFGTLSGSGSSEHPSPSLCVRRMLLWIMCSEFQSNLQFFTYLETAKRNWGGCAVFVLYSDGKYMNRAKETVWVLLRGADVESGDLDFHFDHLNSNSDSCSFNVHRKKPDKISPVAIVTSSEVC